MIRTLCKAVIEGVVLIALLYGGIYLAVAFMPKTEFTVVFGTGEPGIDAVTAVFKVSKIHNPDIRREGILQSPDATMKG